MSGGLMQLVAYGAQYDAYNSGYYGNSQTSGQNSRTSLSRELYLRNVEYHRNHAFYQNHSVQAQNRIRLERHENIQKINEINRKKHTHQKFNSIKIEKRTTLNKGPNTDLECCICMNNYGKKAAIIVLQCRHHSHRGCMQKWLCDQKKNTCPMCRTVVKELV